MSVKTEKPNIYIYHDFRAYLKDWVAFQKATHIGFSMKSLAKEAHLTPAHLSMIMKGKRKLSTKCLALLGPCLSLSSNERSYFDLLVALDASDSQKARNDIIKRMKRYQGFRQNHPKEAVLHEYMTHWYYIAIREMAALPDFKLDARWLHGRLRGRVELADIKKAIEFLAENGFIQVSEQGVVVPPDTEIECLDEIYSVALVQYHREFLSLAADSLENARKDERSILGHSIAFDRQNFREANIILQEAFDKICQLSPSIEQSDSVYHVELCLFPLTKEFSE